MSKKENTLIEFRGLTVFERDDVASRIKGVFGRADRNKDGALSKLELLTTFRQLSDWTDEKFDRLFVGFDLNHDGRIDVEEFVDWVLETGPPEILTAQIRKTVDSAESITYPNGKAVSFSECKMVMQDYVDQLEHPDNKVNHKEILANLMKLPHRKYCRKMHEYFLEVDVNKSGALTWNDKEVFNFFLLVFEKLGLPKPLGGDYVFHGIYSKFDTDQSSSLSEAECLYMMDSVLRVIERFCRQL
jgi:Ca2+-binding EF-hand superfamily protein